MIPVHNHSYYSALDGYSTPDEIAARIADLKLDGAWITDHGTVAGFGAFRKAMEAEGLQPGFGMEAYQARETHPDTGEPAGRKSKWANKQGQDAAHLVLLAKSERGYRNLMHIADESNRTGFHYRPRVDLDLLRDHHEGIICTSACLAGLVAKGLETGDLSMVDGLHRIFDDDFYIELHTYTTEKQRDANVELYKIAKERGIGVLYANDAHYDVIEHYAEHEAYLAAQQHSTLAAPKPYSDKGLDPERYHPPCLYIMDEAEVRAILDYLPSAVVDEAIANSDRIMEQSQYTLEPIYTHLPKARLPEGENPQQKLIELVEDGIYKKYGEDASEEIWERADFELRAIIEAGLHDYFLIVWDYCQWALDHGYFVGPGRGSVGGSILAYVLDITTINPMKYDLQFERFWNPGRSDGLPDIDVDFESANRGKVLDYLKEKYDGDKVLSIGNHSFLWPKAAFDKAAIVLDDGWSDLKKIKAIIETTDDAGQLATWKEVFEQVPDELAPFEKKWSDLFAVAEGFSGRLGSYSIHASAVVISDVPTVEYLPARLAAADDEGKAKELVTQAEMHEVEELGFPKFDLLRLLNLDTIMRTAALSGEFDDGR